MASSPQPSPPKEEEREKNGRLSRFKGVLISIAQMPASEVDEYILQGGMVS